MYSLASGAARDAGADGNNLRVVIVDAGPTHRVTKNGHGLSVGDTLDDGTTSDHQVVVVIDANNVGVREGSAAPVVGNGYTAVAPFTATMWNALPIGTTGLTYKSIAPRPGTSAFASERYISGDEVHVAVIDESTNTIVERMTYLSKLTDGKSPQGSSAYWKDYVNEFSGYVYAGAALTAGQQSTLGADADQAAADYAGTAGSVASLATIRSDAGALLADGADDYAYDAGEIQTAYDEFLDTEETTEIDFVLMGGDAVSRK